MEREASAKKALREEEAPVPRPDWRSASSRPPKVKIVEAPAYECLDSLLQLFIRFTCSKLGRDPSRVLRSRAEFVAWILYQNSREIRDWVRFTVSFVRDTNRVNNELLQEQLASDTWDFYNHHTHLPSLFSETYGGEGFARKRVLVCCAQCQRAMLAATPCQYCYAKGADAQENWLTGSPGFKDEITGPKKCCYWDRKDAENVTVCSLCYQDGYIGKLFCE